MDKQTVMLELEALGKERTKKIYISNGAHEPLFGTSTGDMKPLFKKIKRNHPLAEELYATGNYDAMYFAGMIADPSVMTEADFERWMESAYFYMISDYIVAVTLAETNFAQVVADKWIASGKELYMSAGYSCYCWLLGNRKDDEFDKDKLYKMLKEVEKTINLQTDRVKYSMNYFIITLGISYIPLHTEAVTAAEILDNSSAFGDRKKCNIPFATEYIKKAIESGRLGFKRKNVRC